MPTHSRVLEVAPDYSWAMIGYPGREMAWIFSRQPDMDKALYKELAERLRARGFNAAAINGDIPQNLRERTVDQLKDGRLDILVATDVAARGLDVDRITHVFNYDIPHDTESYVHRIGRTGRAGRSGRAVLFVTPRERRLLKAIERATKSRLNEIQLPSVDEVNESRKEKFNEQLTESLGDPQMQVFRELVTQYATANDVPMEDIAAALATQLQAGEKFLMKEQPKSERPQRRRRHRPEALRLVPPPRPPRREELVAPGDRVGVALGGVLGLEGHRRAHGLERVTAQRQVARGPGGERAC